MQRSVPVTFPQQQGFMGQQAQAQPQQGAWRPAPRAHHYQHQMGRPHRLGQASIATGADVLFSLVTGVGALVTGIAVATMVGADKDKPRPTWKWIGGIVTALGILTILVDVGKISQFSEKTTTVAAQ